MNDTCILYIVRHGQSVANRDKVMGGNPELTDKGVEQAHETQATLADVRFDDAYSSHLRRTSDTAAIITGRPVPGDHQINAFGERIFGRLEGRPESEWVALNREWEAQHRQLPFEQRADMPYAEGVETDRALCDRFMGGLQTVASQHLGQTVLVVTSAGPIRVLLMQLGFADFLTVGSFDNAGYVKLSYDGAGFRIEQTSGVHPA